VSEPTRGLGRIISLVSPGVLHGSDDFPVKMKSMTRNATPLKRLASEEEVAEVVTFLLEKGSSFISGANLPLSDARVFLS
jgi:NAD(P)-dependent dehydrogenase (short-subunit alcohol dehydrogenase family)